MQHRPTDRLRLGPARRRPGAALLEKDGPRCAGYCKVGPTCTHNLHTNRTYLPRRVRRRRVRGRSGRALGGALRLAVRPPAHEAFPTSSSRGPGVSRFRRRPSGSRGRRWTGVPEDLPRSTATARLRLDGVEANALVTHARRPLDGVEKRTQRRTGPARRSARPAAARPSRSPSSQALPARGGRGAGARGLRGRGGCVRPGAARDRQASRANCPAPGLGNRTRALWRARRRPRARRRQPCPGRSRRASTRWRSGPGTSSPRCATSSARGEINRDDLRARRRRVVAGEAAR